MAECFCNHSDPFLTAHFVDFALIPSSVRKEKQFRLPDDLSEFDLTDSLTDEPFHVRFFGPFSSFHIAGRPLFGDPYLKCFTRRGRSKKFQHFLLSEVEIVAY